MNDPSFTSETANGKGKALNLNGVKEQYMSIPYNVFKSLKKYSVSFWVKDFSQGVIFSGIGASSDFCRPRLYVKDSQRFEFNTINYYSGGSYQFSYDCTSIMSSAWHHVVVSTENGLNTLYVDGAKVDAISSNTDGSNATKIDIGGN